MKKQLILTIDEEIIDKAKKYIPNISAFVEECLRQYLGEGNNLTPTSKMHELVDTISKCHLELYLMNKREHIQEAQEKAAQQEIDLAWRHLYAEYRDTGAINPLKLKHATEVLGVSEEDLTDIVEVCHVFCRRDGVDVTDWSNVYEQYGGDEE